MAQIKSGGLASVGALTDVDSTARNPVGTVVDGVDDFGMKAEFIYLKGIGSTIVGSVVTYDEAGVTTLIVANGIGPVAIAMAVTVADTWGWYCIRGTVKADVVANSADNTTVGRETTNGKIGDGRSAGDEIANAVQREATTTAALAYVQIMYPYVDNFQGA
jgi:hypothetical protein